MNKKIRTEVAVGIILVIAIIISGLIWAEDKRQDENKASTNTIKNITSPVQQTPQKENNVGITIAEPIDQWKVCRNDQVRYEVRYPSEWGIYSRMGGVGIETDCKGGNLTFSTKEDVDKTNYNINRANIAVDYSDTSSGSGFVYEGSNSLEEYLAKVEHRPIIKETMVQGKQAVWIEDSPNPYVLFYNDNKVFEIRGQNISEQTFNNFLSTFKFLR